MGTELTRTVKIDSDKWPGGPSAAANEPTVCVLAGGSSAQARVRTVIESLETRFRRPVARPHRRDRQGAARLPNDLIGQFVVSENRMVRISLGHCDSASGCSVRNSTRSEPYAMATSLWESPLKSSRTIAPTSPSSLT